MKYKHITYEDIYSVIKYGFSKRKGTIFSIRKDSFNGLSSPIFFLSTGRTGTKWFADLFRHASGTLVFHAPTPDLSIQSVFAYTLFSKNNFSINDDQKTALKEIFLSAREEQLRYSFKTKKKYIETNNYITFFAPILANLFPDAKFIHLYRHPGEFVRSALDRNYYAQEDPGLIRRIKPISGIYYEQWNQLSQLEKSAWLWNETNSFIEKFKSTLRSHRMIDINLNDLNINKIKAINEFIGTEMKDSIIKKRLSRKSNIQKVRNSEPYSRWNETHKMILYNMCGNLAEHYNYSL